MTRGHDLVLCGKCGEEVEKTKSISVGRNGTSFRCKACNITMVRMSRHKLNAEALANASADEVKEFYQV